MAITTFAAIDIGSYNVTMEIFEMSKNFGIRSINQVCQKLELGKDAFATGKIGQSLVDELCRVLKDFTEIMKEYQVTDYRACATSAVREVRNQVILLEHIYQQTGLKVDILSNSEQRYLGYKSIASKETEFLKSIEKGTAIVDVGGGSLQISLFDKDALVTTQNIRLGNLRIREKLSCLERETTHYEQLVQELIQNEIGNFKRMHVKDRVIKNVILVGDYFADVIAKGGNPNSNIMEYKDFIKWYEKITRRSPLELAADMGIPLEYASLLIPSAVLYRRLIEELGAETIWTPGVQLVDGLAYEYAEKNKFIKRTHDFENDIFMAAKNIGKRYSSSRPHVQNVDMIATAIYDGMRKVHGMGKRERLLLRIAILLHDCGKYISQNFVSESSARIIQATEIIGLSHMEREMIAYVVYFNNNPFEYYVELSRSTPLTREQYLVVAKLTAILRMANAMDRSHLQKVEKVKTSLREKELILTVDTDRDYTLERGLLGDKEDFFQEVYSIRPIVKIRKKL
ncbi:MAG: HD domain-containing protein [Lachnospiraceae bacterium]|nr:HD domain-containing protein [Lachnospiraceae bacterium]MDD3614629.1 HD domain-containing protein [Lachnospiraceae bacterium]